MAKKRQIPHTYVIIFSIIVIAAILTWIIPGGEFERQIKMVNGVERTIIVENSFHKVENTPQTWQVFSALFKGFVDKSDIIVLILMIGGAFWIMNESKAIDVGIMAFLRFTKRLERVKAIKFIGIENIIMTLIMLIFSVFGATFGMSEETIAFIIILVPLAISMGYDSITGVSLVFVAAGLGFAGALLNPFTIGIAQGLSDIPLFSGIEYRLFCWIVINFVGITFILRYARKIKKDPSKSLVYQEDEYWRKKGNSHVEDLKYYTPISAWITYFMLIGAFIVSSIIFPKTELKIGNFDPINWYIVPFTGILFIIFGYISLKKSVHFYILTLLTFTIIYLIIGVMGYGWYMMEIATIFFAMGIIAGIAMNKSPNSIVKLFLEGSKDIMSAALVVGLAGGILMVLQEGKIIDSILYYIAGSMKDVGKIASVGVIYVIQTFINIIIPSGSAQAALTMPIMAPFSDLIGVSRQATVVAFQFGDGFTNMITPTSGVLIGVLEVAKIPYEKWVKWITPFMIILIILGFLLLIPTVTMELNGF